MRGEEVVKSARWLPFDGEWNPTTGICSNCGHASTEAVKSFTSYKPVCPYCGANMYLLAIDWQVKKMDEKLIMTPRANGKSMLQLAKALGTICSVAWGISEAEGFKMALEALMNDEKRQEENEDNE